MNERVLPKGAINLLKTRVMYYSAKIRKERMIKYGFKQNKKRKGITLIALAVTIVVLLILAGVTISSVFSENGIIERAKKAQETIDEAQKNDLAELEKLAEQMEKYTNSNDAVGVDLSEYVTLDLQAYVGRYARQKCDYMQMYVEISDADNENNKVVYKIGTDWKENITKSNKGENNLYLVDNSTLEMLNIVEDDPEYSEKKMTKSYILVNGFNNVKISDLYVKKNKNYNITVAIASAHKSSNEVVNEYIDIYNESTGTITDNSTINFTKTQLGYYTKIYDIDGDGAFTTADSDALENIRNDLLPTYKATVSSGSITITCLLNEKGEILNDTAAKYIGFDIDRNGSIDGNDARIILEAFKNTGIYF